jgi:uncharacterized integral membrane protein
MIEEVLKLIVALFQAAVVVVVLVAAVNGVIMGLMALTPSARRRRREVAKAKAEWARRVAAFLRMLP